MTAAAASKFALFICIAFTIASAGDFHSTRLILSLGGRERNKAVIWLMAKLGTAPGLLVAKLIAVAAIWLVWYSGGWQWMPRRLDFPPFALALALLTIFYGIVVNTNYDEVRIQRDINERKGTNA